VAAEGFALGDVPPLDGVLLTDPESLGAAADDFGHAVHHQPLAVLRPGSLEDVAAIVRFARARGLTVACRGIGHSTQGQAQVGGGIVVDSAGLAGVHDIGPGGAWADAGASWRSVTAATFPHGLTPPVVTDFLDLSVGGTLSGGGIGGESHRHGAQVDNVLELDVVTGAGERRSCSAERDRRLFEAVLAGLGQVAIIVRARLRLVPAPAVARVRQLTYRTLEAFTADATAVALDGRFDHVQGQAFPDPGGSGWTWVMVATTYLAAGAGPNGPGGLDRLHDERAAAVIEDLPYPAFLARIDPIIEAQRQSGAWSHPHPWFDVFVPGPAVDDYVGGVMANLTVEDTGEGPVLLFPLRRSRCARPNLRLPGAEVSFLFDVLRTAPPDPAALEAMVAANRRLYERVRAAGGTRYCIGTVPFGHADWRAHFGERWEAFALARRELDPDGILTPGQGIFER
jgi:FAD/FMN-containing dehydrogenase